LGGGDYLKKRERKCEKKKKKGKLPVIWSRQKGGF